MEGLAAEDGHVERVSAEHLALCRVEIRRRARLRMTGRDVPRPVRRYEIFFSPKLTPVAIWPADSVTVTLALVVRLKPVLSRHWIT